MSVLCAEYIGGFPYNEWGNFKGFIKKFWGKCSDLRSVWNSVINYSLLFSATWFRLWSHGSKYFTNFLERQANKFLVIVNKSKNTINNLVCTWCNLSVADLNNNILDAHLPNPSNFLNFMSFSGKFGRIIGYCPLSDWCALSGKSWICHW